MLFEIGDHVRLKGPGIPNPKGKVVGQCGSKVMVSFSGVPHPLPVDPAELRNYSLAARKAWTTGRRGKVAGNSQGTPYHCGKLEFLVSCAKNSQEADYFAMLHLDEVHHGKSYTPDDFSRRTKGRVPVIEASEILKRYGLTKLKFALTKNWAAQEI